MRWGSTAYSKGEQGPSSVQRPLVVGPSGGRSRSAKGVAGPAWPGLSLSVKGSVVSRTALRPAGFAHPSELPEVCQPQQDSLSL